MVASADSHEPHLRTVTIQHEFKATRDIVWAAWTKPEHLGQWWGPEQFTNPTCEIDVRPGGMMRIDMRGPDGMVYPMTGEFKEVVAPERLVFVVTPRDATGAPMFEVLQTAVFTESGDRTLFTLEARVLSAGPEAAPYLGGMEEGWRQSLRKLDRLIESFS